MNTDSPYDTTPPGSSSTGAPSSPKRLVRSTNRKVAGVAGGIADYVGMDATLVRILLVVLTIVTIGNSIGFFVPGIVVYLAAWMLIPDGGSGQ